MQDQTPTCGAASGSAANPITTSRPKRIPELSLELAYSCYSTREWAEGMPTALLIDGDGKVYLERAEDRTATSGAHDGEELEGIFTDNGEWKPVEEVLEGEIQTVTIGQALEWFALAEDYGVSYSGSAARLLLLAANALWAV